MIPCHSYILFCYVYSSIGAVAVIGLFGQGAGAIVQDFVSCEGNEMNLTSCRSDLSDFHSRSSDAGIRCHPGEA